MSVGTAFHPRTTALNVTLGENPDRSAVESLKLGDTSSPLCVPKASPPLVCTLDQSELAFDHRPPSEITGSVRLKFVV